MRLPQPAGGDVEVRTGRQQQQLELPIASVGEGDH